MYYYHETEVCWWQTYLSLFLAPWGWPSRGGAVLYRLSPQFGEDPPVEDPGLCDPPGEPGWLSW